MLRRILGTVFLLVTFLLSPTSATAQRYDSVVIMGDSSADDGYQSDHLKAGRLEYYGIPVSPEQGVNGRFSNGLSIPEQLYHELGFSFLETENYAVGAAQTGWGFSPDSFWPPVYMLGTERNWNNPDGQITRLLAHHNNELNPSSLYYIAIGANDFNPLMGSLPDPTLTQHHLVDGYTRLIDAGARKFFVTNHYMFGLGMMPLNAILPEVMRELRETRGVEIIYFDADSLSFVMATNPAAFGFNPATAHLPCLIGGINTCTPEEAAERYNWDDLHLTAAANAIIGRAGARFVTAPETLGVVIFPALQQIDVTRSQILSRLNYLRSASQRNAPVKLASTSSSLSQFDLNSREGEAGIFIRINYGNFRRSETRLSPLLDGDNFMAVAGVDFDISSSLRVGIAASYGEGSSTIAARDSSDMSTYGASLYGVWMSETTSPHLRPVIEALASLVRLNGETKRDVGFAGVFAQSNQKGWLHAASLKGGIDLPLGSVIATPEIQFVWQRAVIDGYTETGAPAGLNLAVAEQSRNSFTSEVGGKIGIDFHNVKPSLSLHWIHEFDNDLMTTTVAPDSFPQLLFTSQSDKEDRDYGRIQLQMSGDLGKSAQLEVGYRQTFLRDNWREQSFHIEVRIPL